MFLIIIEFENGCNAPGDGVDDTAYEKSPSYDCRVGRNTCPQAGLDPIYNYMDYGTGSCMTEFTNGQKIRMHAMWETYRKSARGPTPTSPTAPSVPSSPTRPSPSTPTSIPTIFPQFGGDFSCFSGKNHVFVQGKGVTSMESLEIGDLVRTGNDRRDVSRVLSFLHKDSEKQVEYLQIYSELTPIPLEVSHDHFVFLNKHQVVRARDIKAGDLLTDGNAVTIVKTIKRHGLYAPITENGELMVSGIHASCYAASSGPVYPIVQVKMSHAALTPLRIACAIDFSTCIDDFYSEYGFSMNAIGLVELGFQISVLCHAVLWTVIFASLPILAGLRILEGIVCCPFVVSAGVVLLFYPT